MIATLLMHLLRQQTLGSEVTRFHFKAIRPTFDLHPVQLSGQRVGPQVRLWVQDHEGALTMQVEATLRTQA